MSRHVLDTGESTRAGGTAVLARCSVREATYLPTRKHYHIITWIADLPELALASRSELASITEDVFVRCLSNHGKASHFGIALE